MARLRTEHLLCSAVALYLVTCYYVYIAVDLQVKHTEAWPVFNVIRNKNGSWQVFQDECPLFHAVVKHSHLSRLHPPQNITQLQPGSCTNRFYPVHHGDKNTILMEKEWSKIDVSYPQFVYTVSGWIQVVDVPSYTAKPALRVFVVPYSHVDVGWLDTVNGCYEVAASTLNHAVVKLAEHQNWKFIWAELAYLSRWYNTASEAQRQSLKRAIADGQLEIVTGGWVMSEEACAHYVPMMDQLIEGHLWLNATLGVHPVNSWSVDPFGHSPTMAYLLRESRIRHMVIQRVHFAVKKHLARSQNLEFNWRQQWDVSGVTDMSCHLMPFLTYAVLYSCGPDPHVCCQFDFLHDKCTRGQKFIKPVPVSNDNVKKLAWALWEQYQKKAQLYRSNVLLVPHGDDFRYASLKEWDVQLGNMEKLMTYMNGDKDMNVKVEFGTLSDYFKAVEAERGQQAFTQTPRQQLPVMIGDFFPYNDRDDQYWTGYYTSRPLYKYMSRFLQGRLRFAEVLFTLTLARLIRIRERGLLTEFNGKLQDLQEARQAQSVFMHHDAITGTSRKSVVKDYANLLQLATSKVDSLLKVLMSLMASDETHTSLADHQHLQMREAWPVATEPPVFTVAEKSTRMIVVSNPLTIGWVYAVKIHISDPNVQVMTTQGVPVPQQINPVFSKDLVMSDSVFELVFEADMPPLSVKSYKLEPHQGTDNGFASVTLFNLNRDHFGNALPFKMLHSTEETFSIENRITKATFSRCTGTMQHIQRKSDDIGHNVGVKFMTYGTGSWTNPLKDKSGAYIFLPDGPAQDVDIKYPSVVVVEGPVLSSVYTHMPGVLHTATLYNVSGAMGAGVHIENMVNLANAKWDNKELVMRLDTDIRSAHDDVCVDLNGFQMTRKQWRSKLLIQGNFHPINTMAYIENQLQSRLSLVTAQPHGAASLNSGWLEVVLDRRLMQDDWRGLGQGVTDNTHTPSKFVLLLERQISGSSAQDTSSSHPCRPSVLAHLLSEHLNNPPLVATSHQTRSATRNPSLLTSPFPCSLDLVNLRTLSFGGDFTSVSSLMVLHSTGVECGIWDIHTPCDMKKPVDINMFEGVKVTRNVKTSLTGVHDVKEIADGKIGEVPEMELHTYKLTFS